MIDSYSSLIQHNEIVELRHRQPARLTQLYNFQIAGLEVIKLEFILRLKIKRNDWLLADTCPQVANHCALF